MQDTHASEATHTPLSYSGGFSQFTSSGQEKSQVYQIILTFRHGGHNRLEPHINLYHTLEDYHSLHLLAKRSLRFIK